MKFNIKKEVLLKPLQKLNSIICVNQEYPITSNILIKIQKNYIFFISTNLELEITTKIPLLNYYNYYEMNISGKKLLNVIRSFPNNSNIHFNICKEMIKIKHQNIYFKLNISNNNIFPKFIKEENTTNIILPQKVLQNIIHNTYFSMAKQDIRHYLNGMYIEINKNKIFAVSTDGYRMSICQANIGQINNFLSIVLPRKTIIELMKILENNDTSFKMCVGLNTVQFYINEYIITSKLIDNEFPNYKNLFIQEFHTTIKINKKILQKALIRASLLTNQQFPGVKLLINHKKCIISTKNEYHEIVKEEFEINNIHTVIELTMNIYYFLDVINILNNEFITILLNKNISSIYIQQIEIYHSFYIIMPFII